MNKRSLLMLVVGLSLMVFTTGFIRYRQTHQRLGSPGVKVVPEPIYGEEKNLVSTNSIFLPERVLDFTSEIVPIGKIVTDYLPKDTVFGQRVYRGPDDFHIGLNAVLMGTDRSSIHKPQYCLLGTGWNIVGTELTNVMVSRPHVYSLPLMKLNLERTVETPEGPVTRKGYYVYWFVADQQLTADHNQRMWWMTRELLRTGVLHRWAYVSCFVVCPPGGEEATYVRLSRFISEAVPEFQITTGAPVSALAKAAP